jgi:hypothetical protein
MADVARHHNHYPPSRQQQHQHHRHHVSSRHEVPKCVTMTWRVTTLADIARDVKACRFHETFFQNALGE